MAYRIESLHSSVPLLNDKIFAEAEIPTYRSRSPTEEQGFFFFFVTRHVQYKGIARKATFVSEMAKPCGPMLITYAISDMYIDFP